MVGQWLTNDVYSYCFLIPVISGYLVWIRRETLRRLETIPGTGAGIVLVTVGLLMLVMGQAGGVLALQEVSLIITGAGLILFLWGKEYFKELWFAIGYLVFMIPSWEIFTDQLHYPFQQLSATLGVAFLWLIGIPVYQKDVFIELPNITLQVARVCSGINYLISVLAIGLPLAYVFLRGWRRLALLPFALIVAVISNGLRVSLIGALSYYGLNPTIHGPFHVLQGIFVSFIGYFALFAGVAVLRKGTAAPGVVLSETGALVGQQAKVGGQYRPISFTAMFVLLLLTGSYLYFHGERPVLLTKDLHTFPMEIGPWQGKEPKPDNLFFQKIAHVFRAVGVDHDLLRNYSRGTEEIALYIGYFETQRQGKELINYQTVDLYQSVSQVVLDIEGSALEVNQALYMEGKETRLVLFWYDLDGWLVADRLQVQMITAWRWFISGRTSGSIIFLCVPLESGGEPESAFTRGVDFIREATPLLDSYISRRRGCIDRCSNVS
jgi:EpsI family protein